MQKTENTTEYRKHAAKMTQKNTVCANEEMSVQAGG